MAYKATGRPVGRPKTKEYVTLLARVPADLAELVKKYADQHGQSVAALLREGVEWRIGDGDPRGIGMYLAQPTGIREHAYSSNTGTASAPQGDEALQEVRTLLARQWEQIQVLAQALEQQRVPVSDGAYSSNTTMPATDVAISYQEAQHTQSAPLTEEQGPGSTISTTVPPYDPATRVLGKLCPRKHEWGNTGQSLLSKRNNGCLACEAEKKREREKAKREAQSVTG